jgi:formylglycine-generating enzyme required for sulfatase activity
VPLETGSVGALPGLYDMSGNANEYSNAYGDGGTPTATDTCSLHGGSWQLTAVYSRCDELTTIARNYAGAPQIGFRCCKDP